MTTWVQSLGLTNEEPHGAKTLLTESPKHKANSATTTLKMCPTTELLGSELYRHSRQMTIPLGVRLQ